VRQALQNIVLTEGTQIQININENTSVSWIW